MIQGQNSSQDPTALAALELAALQARMALARDTLAALREVNEQLVLTTLVTQAGAETTPGTRQPGAPAAAPDALTALPNRVLLLDRFTLAIAQARRQGIRLALLCVDLNNFKQIDATLGPATGDLVLQRAARCLVSTVRESDTVSRHRGADFLILLTEMSGPHDAAAVADKLVAALAAPQRLGDHIVRLSASIGISLYPEDGDDPQTLIERADGAMFRARRQGQGTYVFYSAEPASAWPRARLPLPSLQRPLTDYVRAHVEREDRYLQLREANEQLLLAALDARELLAAAEKARLQQAEYLAVLSHELRSPLMSIRTASAVVGRVPDDERVRERMQAVIERQVGYMARLLGDLFEASRTETVAAQRLPLERRRVDMLDIVDGAVEASLPAMDLRMQRFLVQVPPHALPVDGDPLRLTQIVRNLFDNASKYTPEGGEIRLSLALAGDTVELAVSDNGIGIAPAALTQIFEPFARAAHASAFTADGLGLGLAVVRELVQAHGGQVCASSAGIGLGSRFVVTLPLAPGLRDSPASPGSPGSPDSPG